MEFIDWNKLTIEQYIEHLENKFQFDSSGTAKAVFELIAAYRALTIPVVRACCLCGNDFTPSKQLPNDTACKNCHKKLRGY